MKIVAETTYRVRMWFLRDAVGRWWTGCCWSSSRDAACCWVEEESARRVCDHAREHGDKEAVLEEVDFAVAPHK